jgi:hypothetical protein
VKGKKERCAATEDSAVDDLGCTEQHKEAELGAEQERERLVTEVTDSLTTGAARGFVGSATYAHSGHGVRKRGDTDHFKRPRRRFDAATSPKSCRVTCAATRPNRKSRPARVKTRDVG